MRKRVFGPWYEGFLALGLAKGEYCAMSGYIDFIRRDTKCMDVLVTPAAFSRLVAQTAPILKSPLGSDYLEFDSKVLIFKDDGLGRSAIEWIRNCAVLGGVAVGSVEDLLEWKEQVIKSPARSAEMIKKDVRDIQFLGRHEYLVRHYQAWLACSDLGPESYYRRPLDDYRNHPRVNGKPVAIMRGIGRVKAQELAENFQIYTIEDWIQKRRLVQESEEFGYLDKFLERQMPRR